MVGRTFATRRGVLLGAGAAALAAPAVVRAREVDPAEAVDAFVRRALAAWPEQPGVAVAAVRDGRTLIARGYGLRRIGRPEPVTDTTLFAIASNTKAMTAAGLAVLVDDGRLSWEDPVVKHLPEFAMSDPRTTELMTVRDLLSHRSGLALGAGDMMFWPDSDRTRAEIVAGLRHVPLANTFRHSYAYHNALYVVAGEVIHRVSGEPIEVFFRRRFLDPLGMAETVVLPKTAPRDRIAWPHGRVGGLVRGLGGKVTPLADIWDWGQAAAAGGLVSSASEWTAWMKVQLAQGALPGGGRLWSETQAKEMWTPRVVIASSDGPTAENRARPMFATYALGWNVSEFRGERLVMHGGGAPGFISTTVLIPGRNTGYCVFLNGEESYLLRTLRFGLADVLAGRSDVDWIEESLRLNREADEKNTKDALAALTPPANAARPSLPLEAYAGVWRDPWYGVVVIARRGRGLTIAFSRTPSLTGALEPFDGERFRTRFTDPAEEDAFVTFELENGRPVRATLKAASPIADFSYDYHNLRLTRVG